MRTITSVEELEKLYDAPVAAAMIKVAPALTPEYRRLIEAAPFVALATSGPEGLDCSPRGDEGQVVHIENERVLLLPDWRGNNRIDSLKNIVRDARVALMFLIPGCNNVLRVNGRGAVVIEPEMLTRFTMRGKHPRSVIRIEIEEAYFQCARALIRARLWDRRTWPDPASLPTPGDMLKGASPDFDAESYDSNWTERAKTTMW